MRDGFGIKVEKYFSILIQVPFRDLESEKLFSYVDVLRLGTISWETTTTTKTIWSKRFSGVFLLELSATFGMLGKVLSDYLSSRTLAFLLLLWFLLHAHASFLFPVSHGLELSPPQTHAQSSPSSHLPCHGSQDTDSQLLCTCLFLHRFAELGRNKLLTDAFVYHSNSPFLPHLPSSIYNYAIFPFAVRNICLGPNQLSWNPVRHHKKVSRIKAPLSISVTTIWVWAGMLWVEILSYMSTAGLMSKEIKVTWNYFCNFVKLLAILYR